MKGSDINKLGFILGNLSFDELADSGVLNRKPDGSPSVGGSDWNRFNKDIVTFFCKLPEGRLDKLAILLKSKGLGC